MRAIKAGSRGEQRAKSKEQGAGSSKRRAFRLSVLGYQVDKGENYRTSGRRTSITSRSTRSRYSIRKDYSLYFFWSSSNSIQWAGSRSFILVASVFLNSSSFAV